MPFLTFTLCRPACKALDSHMFSKPLIIRIKSCQSIWQQASHFFADLCRRSNVLKDVPPATLINPSSAKGVPPATLINPNSAQDVPSAVCVSPSSAEEGSDGGSLAVADSETGPPPAAIPNNIPLMPTFAICDGIQNTLTRYTFFWALEQPSLSS